MKFLIDAQLPYRLKLWLIENDFDTIHTDDLPERNLTADYQLLTLPTKIAEQSSAKTAIF